MGINRFQHVDLRVNDRAKAEAFYDALMPALGFARKDAGELWVCYDAEGEPPWRPWVALTEEKDHAPNANRVAFSAASRAEVDRIAPIVRAAGGRIESGPRACAEYSAGYYALFFEDPFGNRLEVCFNEV